MTRLQIDELLSLPAQERIELAERLWESVTEEALPEWQADLLDRRLAEVEQDPSRWVSWDEAIAPARASLARRKA
ncbi:MAG TPA: addiction module protein [Thermoanaerobaculia bacterium]|nr:addiction module protein [Thermoanaerobaculia bacterium]